MSFDSLLSLDDVKKESFIIEHILWDVEPKTLMGEKGKSLNESAPLSGYIFYIDIMDKEPMLYLIRHTAANYAETLARIDNIPQELLNDAVEENKEKIFFSMCPINKKVESWLKKELDAAS
ncbi:MAG: hypothetical protein L0Y62_00795 [Nitrospirae bacterium]|nr:hypothetical protein [Nitrospirota bacterium]